MTNLNQVSESYDHEQAVCDSIIDKIKAAQSQINMTREYFALVEPLSETIVITVSESAFATPIPMTFGRSPSGLKKALEYINKYVKVSPVSPSSAKDGFLFGCPANTELLEAPKGVNDSE